MTEITNQDLLALLLFEIRDKGLSKHNIDSMNEFLRHGIKQIITKTFSITGRLVNERNAEEEDREISDIEYEVHFTDARVMQPQYTDLSTEEPILLTPSTARLSNIDYCCNVYIDVEIKSTAYLRNGNPRTKTFRINNVHAATVPCMTGTEMCITHQKPVHILKALHEDPHSYQGVFILKGNEWIVDSTENMITNVFRVHKTMHENDICSGRVISRKGIHFEPTFETIISFTKNGGIFIDYNIGQNRRSPPIPFYVLYRAMGITSDREIVESIVYDIGAKDALTQNLLSIINIAFEKLGSISSCSNYGIGNA